MIVAQLSDTHVVRPGTTYFGIETARYLSDAIAALNQLDPRPDVVIVTGDLVNFGHDAEYVRFAELMSASRIPYYVIPGNHDDRDRMRAVLPSATYGGSTDARVRFAIDDFEVRLICIDSTAPRPWPGATLDAATLAWFEVTLANAPQKATIVCLHQPPFRTGLHYLDAFGFGGARRLRRAIGAHPNVGRVICGHIHCVRSARIGNALAQSAPSTSPQVVPELFERRAFALRHEVPGFALHGWDAARGFATTILRRDETGRYVAVADSAAFDANAPG
ncbi:MAG: phosphodiesterase [Candidatus Eremiobacteraeota bacterium]|nr:phosphodiesterase [Candidatus Eremiobacteraeota bacterium]